MSNKRKREEAQVEVDTNSAEATQTERASKQSRSLFVRSLARTTTDESLVAHFSQKFPVKHVTAVKDKATGQCKGYGFVTLADAEDANAAKQEFDNSVLDGRHIKLELAEPRHRQVQDSAAADVGLVSKKPRTEDDASSTTKKQLPSASRLIIRNLPWTIKKPEQLASLFTSYGKVKDVQLPEKKPGLLKGFGFVVLRKKKGAQRAVNELNGVELDGRTLAVDWAVDRTTWQQQQQPVAGDEDGDSEGLEANEEAQSDDEEGGAPLLPNGIVEADDDDADDFDHEEDSEAEADAEDDSGMAEDSRDDEKPPERLDNTMFIRNLPFSVDDDALYSHFSKFGRLKYARVVMDPATTRSRGTGFVAFVKDEDAHECLKNAPKNLTEEKAAPSAAQSHSVLQNEAADPSGAYTLEGRVLLVARAVNRTEASRLVEAETTARTANQRDKRRLYLLDEGTLSKSSPLYNSLPPSEIATREASFKQRRDILKSNPSLHLSLTRLSVRNIPRTVNSRDLKELARQAVVGFASDVKEGKRERLSKEELSRDKEDTEDAERQRKLKGKGIVKQAKVVFEGREGAKISENSGAGKSRGYGFIEYYTHRNALMGLRWLNGHAIDYKAEETGKGGKKQSRERKKRLIIEFAIENVQVTTRRRDREAKARERATAPRPDVSSHIPENGKVTQPTNVAQSNGPSTATSSTAGKIDAQEKLKKRQQIINKKRAKRREKHRTGKS